MHRYSQILFGYLAFVCSGAFAQSSDSVEHRLSIDYSYGTIWTERSSLQPFTLNHPSVIQASWARTSIRYAVWNSCRCFTTNGASLMYLNFGNPSALGSAVVLSAFTEPRLLAFRRLDISVRGTTGLAFLSKLYDSVSNRDAIFFSTPMSFYLSLSVRASYQLSPHVSLSAGAQLQHISNGGRRDPNEGMNIFGASASVSYLLNPIPRPRFVKERFSNHFELWLHGFGTQRVAQATPIFSEQRGWTLGLHAAAMRTISRVNAVGVGAEIYYDGINTVYTQRNQQPINTTVAAAGVEHYLLLGKLLFGQTVLWYITPNTGIAQSFYQRYYLGYAVAPNWYAGVTLKAHADHSDFFAISISRRWKF